jgi:Rieske Fe-S protein
VKRELDRRGALRLLARGCLAAAALPWLPGCRTATEADGPVTLDRAEVERAGRTVVTWNDQPVEVRFTGDGFEARSLACTHLGCTVRWVPRREHYACPCHEGYYDAQGNPLGGPPTTPLRSVPVRVAEGRLVVGS